MKMKRCAAGISLLCLMTLSGCIPAPTSPPPTIIYAGCPKVSSCPLPGSNPKTNGDLSADIFNLERALASCALQVETVKSVRRNSMLKPKSLRQALYDAVPKLRANPDMLRIFIDSGVIGATLAASCHLRIAIRSM